MQVPGRVGDASIPGGGAYAESGVGGCASTGNGDLHIRFLPCHQACRSYDEDCQRDFNIAIKPQLAIVPLPHKEKQPLLAFVL